MKEIKRYNINEDWAHSGIIQAGDYCFINYCARNIGGTIEEQIDGAFDVKIFFISSRKSSDFAPGGLGFSMQKAHENTSRRRHVNSNPTNP